MTSPDPRRRFSASQRNALFLASDGLCTRCGDPLPEGWHADHVSPWSAGGPTELTNGEATCPRCNLQKGAKRVTYRDTFTPRPFQADVIQSVIDGMTSGRRSTTVLAAPGSGKTITYQATANLLHRLGDIDFVAIFVPRLVLAKQCETGWMWRDSITGDMNGSHELFDARDRLGMIRHIQQARLPLTPPTAKGVGFVATYSALVTNPAVFLDGWAKVHAGRFLLVADEAQFCGTSNDEASGGTRAGTWMQEMHRYAAHTLLLTGTPYRSDGQPLILVDYEEPDENGYRRILAHAEASYADGIAEGYLRRFEATMHDARVHWRGVDSTKIEYNLSASGLDLRDVLRQQDVWQPICDDVVTKVHEKQQVNRGYRGLISCMEQNEAKRVHDYLTHRYPGLRVALSISEDGPEAEKALRDFKAQPYDVLVTVRKAFIGYDCPEISVVGILTNYRDKGHLMQLVGRGLRMWKDAEGQDQSCLVVCPDDPEMQEFVRFMQDESEAGLRRRESIGGGGGGGGTPEILGYVETAYETTARAVSNDGEVGHEERVAILALKEKLGIGGDVTDLAKVIEAVGGTLTPFMPEPPQASARIAPPARTPLTAAEQVKEIDKKTSDILKRYVVNQMGIQPYDPAYRKAIATLTARVNASAGVRAGQSWDAEQARKRLNAAVSLQA